MTTAQTRWNRENAVQIKMKLIKSTDADVLDLLGSLSNKQGYIKRLIRDDVVGEKKYRMFMPDLDDGGSDPDAPGQDS